MYRSIVLYSAFVLLTGGFACARMQRSCAPCIYVIDYSDKWITDPEAAKTFGNMPPDILHIGKAVPVTHNWGPIPLMAGENQYTGGPGHTLDWNAIRLLSPEELEQKITNITAAVERLHTAGVKQVMPYICHYTLAGDHEKHEGFWRFYDQWDLFSRWLGPRPPENPTEWLTKDASGKRIDTDYGYTPPYFAPLHRYAVCPNNPSWNQFSVAIVKLIAQCGYDGVFVDNSILGGDACKYCQAAFRKWMGENYTQAAITRACGEPIDDITLSDKRLALFLQRWHTAVVRDRLAMLRNAGKQVRPDFQIFPNVGYYHKAIPFGDGCDLFMFESIPPPGCLVDGDLPPSPEALVSVAPEAALALSTMIYESRRSDLFSEVQANIRYPRQCPPGKPTAIAIKVLTVGDSNKDSDCVEDLRIRFTNLKTGEKEEVSLGPEPGVGDPRTVNGAKRPPVELMGTWTPKAIGDYTLDLLYKYTDREHLDVANHTPVTERLSLGNVFRSNLPGLSCTYNSRSRMIGLMLKVTNKGWEPVQELALAEGAASGGRYAIQSRGEPQRKYWKFFRQYGDRIARLVPYGSVSLLYAYWGGNPGNLGHSATSTVAEYLSSQHILYRGLVDRDLEVTDLIPARGHTLVLVCRDYELKPDQIKALQRFISDGGRLIVEHTETRVNFYPIARVLGPAANRVLRWDWMNPPQIAAPLCGSEGRLQGLRFAAFIEPSPKPGRLLLHAVNYNVTCVESQPGVVTPVENLCIRLHVPALWKQVQATAFNPDVENPMSVCCRRSKDLVELTLPPFRIYQMVELRGSP